MLYRKNQSYKAYEFMDILIVLGLIATVLYLIFQVLRWAA